MAALGATLVGLGVWVAQANLYPAGHTLGDADCWGFGDHYHVLDRWVLWP